MLGGRLTPEPAGEEVSRGLEGGWPVLGGQPSACVAGGTARAGAALLEEGPLRLGG